MRILFVDFYFISWCKRPHRGGAVSMRVGASGRSHYLSQTSISMTAMAGHVDQIFFGDSAGSPPFYVVGGNLCAIELRALFSG